MEWCETCINFMLQVYLASPDHDAVTPQAAGPAAWWKCFNYTMIRFAAKKQEFSICPWYSWSNRNLWFSYKMYKPYPLLYLNSVCFTVSLSPCILFNHFTRCCRTWWRRFKLLNTCPGSQCIWKVLGFWHWSFQDWFCLDKKWDSIFRYFSASVTKKPHPASTETAARGFEAVCVSSVLPELDLVKLPESFSQNFRGMFPWGCLSHGMDSFPRRSKGVEEPLQLNGSSLKRWLRFCWISTVAIEKNKGLVAISS